MMERQVDDHLQGHLDEIYHVKHTLAATEEKMAYLSYERAKEIWVRSCGGLQHPLRPGEGWENEQTSSEGPQPEASSKSSSHPLLRVQGRAVPRVSSCLSLPPFS